MKKSIFILLVIFSIFIASCAPQVTVTSEVTVTSVPPTKTPIPTPTLHPQFIALQEQIAATGERFTLLSDGTVQDGATAIPGLQVASDGKATILVNGEPVEIDPAIMNFDDEKGLSIKGYQDTDQNGDWTIDIPPIETVEAAQPTLELLKRMNVPISVEGSPIEVKMKGEDVLCIEVETQKQVCKNAKFNTDFLKRMTDLYGNPIDTGYGEKKGNYSPGTPSDEVRTVYCIDLLDRAISANEINGWGFDIAKGRGGAFAVEMIREKSWGMIRLENPDNPEAPKFWIYENDKKEVIIIPII